MRPDIQFLMGCIPTNLGGSKYCRHYCDVFRQSSRAGSDVFWQGIDLRIFDYLFFDNIVFDKGLELTGISNKLVGEAAPERVLSPDHIIF